MPISRSFLKQIYRYTRARTYRHNEKIWPYMQVKRRANAVLVASYRGQTIESLPVDEVDIQSDDLVIVASGPSVKQLDLSALSHADWLLVNGAINIMAAYPTQKVRYFVVVDQGFIADRLELVQQMVSQTDAVFFTNLFCLNLLYQLLGPAAVKCRVSILEDRQLPIYLPCKRPVEMEALAQQHHAAMVWDAASEVGFSWDMNQGYISGGTVVYIALQLAAHLGYKRVFLAGVDMTRFNEPRFYENNDNRLDTKLADEFVNFVYPSFKLASTVYQKHGIQAYNLCLDSGLDDAIFSRVKVSDVLHSPIGSQPS